MFWVLFATFFICGLSTDGPIDTDWITLCGDFGVAPVGAAEHPGGDRRVRFFRHDPVGAGPPTATTTVGRSFFYYGLRGLSLIYLPHTDFSVFGFRPSQSSTVSIGSQRCPPTVRLTAERFGPERANLTFGWIFTAPSARRSDGRFRRAGVSRTELSTYLPALYVAGVACVIAAALALTIARPARKASALAA